MRKLGIRMWHVALAAGVSSELVAPSNSAAVLVCSGVNACGAGELSPRRGATRKGFQGMRGQKRNRKNKAPESTSRAGGSSRPRLAIPCRVAPQQSPTPFHQTGLPYHTRSVQNQTSSPSIGQLASPLPSSIRCEAENSPWDSSTDLPARRLARTTIHELYRLRLSGIV